MVEEEAAQNMQAGRQAVVQYQLDAAVASEQAEQPTARLQTAEANAGNLVAQVEDEAANPLKLSKDLCPQSLENQDAEPQEEPGDEDASCR
eukprot:s7315_g3.t1